MAEHLASIFGTEKDRVNCPFYFKIGQVFISWEHCSFTPQQLLLLTLLF